MEGSGKGAVLLSLLGNRHITKHHHTWLGNERYVKACLSARLINTWEHFARMVAFKLGCEELAGRTIMLVVAGVETSHGIGNGAGKINLYSVLASSKSGLGKPELVVLMVAIGGWFIIDCGLRYRQVFRVQAETTSMLHSTGNGDRTAKATAWPV